jgi:flagellar biogenesis protein FliO
MEWILVKTLLSLSGVIGLMVALMMVAKKYMVAGRPGQSAVVEVEILGQRALQPKRSVFVLKVLNKVIVVGMTEHGMQSLTEIEDADSLATVEERLGARPPASRWLTWNLRPGTGAAPVTFARHLQKYTEGLFRKRPAGSRQQPLT